MSEWLAYIGFGSNVGERLRTVLSALSLLQASPGLSICSVSSLYETEAVGYEKQADFINGVVAVFTRLRPLRLLRRLQTVEKRLGRMREIRWGPRTIDLDILLYGDLVLVSDELTIPHPEMQNRRFVLVPLAEIAQDDHVPGTGKRIGQLLAATTDKSRVDLFMTSADVKEKLKEV